MSSEFNSSSLSSIQESNAITMHFILKIFLYILVIFFVFIMVSSIGGMCSGPYTVEGYQNGGIPPLEPMEYRSYEDKKFPLTYNNYTHFQNTQLVAPDTPNSTPKHLLFGNAKKFISESESKIEVYANLYVLGGNVMKSGVPTATGKNSLDTSFNNYSDFNQAKAIDEYKVYTSDSMDGSSEMLIGNLYKDGDGIYKLKEKINLKDSKYIKIYFETADDKVLLLVGKFR